MLQERGKYVVFEGPGGAGKGTQIEFAENLLINNGLTVITSREPGGEKDAEGIRDLIFRVKRKELIAPDVEMVLFFKAREILAKRILIPSLDNGINVLGDRSYVATAAYQGYGGGIDLENVIKLARYFIGDVRPDGVILLDISTQTSMSRRANPEGDPFDMQQKEYFDRVIAGYREMAENGWGGLKWYRINGEQSPNTVSKSVAVALEDIFCRQLVR